MTKRRIVVGAIACALVASAIVVTQVGFGADSGPDSTTRSSSATPASSPEPPSDAEARSRDPGRPSRDGGKHQGPIVSRFHIEPAEMIGSTGLIPGSVLSPDNGGWRAGSHTHTTLVIAGGDARHRSDGLFAIIRENHLRATQGSNFVRVAGSGPVTITKAPLGRKVVVWAQKRGKIQFKSKSGMTGTLYLKNDTITLNP